jgi:hypothetical protein
MPDRVPPCPSRCWIDVKKFYYPTGETNRKGNPVKRPGFVTKLMIKPDRGGEPIWFTVTYRHASGHSFSDSRDRKSYKKGIELCRVLGQFLNDFQIQSMMDQLSIT